MPNRSTDTTMPNRSTDSTSGMNKDGTAMKSGSTDATMPNRSTRGSADPMNNNNSGSGTRTERAPRADRN